jgi:uncharacterized protein (DUF433 family)
MATSTKWQYLERDPMSSYRQLSIKGRRIKARTLAGAFFNAEEPMTVEEIAANWNVPIEAVRESIAYVESKPIELEQDFRFEDAMVELAGHNEPGAMGRWLRPVPPEVELKLRKEIYGDDTGAE